MSRALLQLFGLTTSRIFLFAGLTLLAAFFEGFGMAMFLPVLEYVEKGQDVTRLVDASEMWRKLLLAYDFFGVEVSLFSLLFVAVSLMLLRVLGMYARQVYSAWLGQLVRHSLRTNLFGAYMTMDYRAFTHLSSGAIINVLTTETERAAGSFMSLFALVSNVAVVLVLAILLLWLSVPLTLLAIVFLGFSGVFVSYHVRHTRKNSHAYTAANERYARIVLDRIAGFRFIKLTATADREVKRARHASQEVSGLHFWITRTVASVDLIVEPMVLLSGGAILYFAINFFGMSLSAVGIFAMILIRLLPLTKEIIKSRQSYNACAGSLRAVISGHAQATSAKEFQGGSKAFGKLQKSIRFSNVTFTYPNGVVPVLQNLNLDIPAGKTTALVGPSGAGKTTLVDLIARLSVPQKGHIYYDEVEGAEYDLASLRSDIAFVSQDAAIFDGTIADNLLFVRPEATEDELWAALAQAQADDFVRSFEDGLQTCLGERGTRLSGGQKQRLSLARALLQKTSVLILDEPTSALDSETERDIQKSFDELRAKEQKTIIIIAHRLSTIRSADKIVVLINGRITEQGSHDNLVLSEEWYATATGMLYGAEAAG